MPPCAVGDTEAKRPETRSLGVPALGPDATLPYLTAVQITKIEAFVKKQFDSSAESRKQITVWKDVRARCEVYAETLAALEAAVAATLQVRAHIAG